MAAYIPVPRDLTRVKSKILFNLTKRQLICFGAGALIGVPSFFLIKSAGSTSMASICIGQFIQAKFIRPKVRPYQTNNYYAALIRQAQTEMEVNRIVYNKKSVP